MNPKSFEQIEIKKDIVGKKGKLLTENLEVVVNFYNEVKWYFPKMKNNQ